MAQTTYEEYLANLMGNINPQGGMVTGQMPQATPTAPPPQMAMPDLSAIQQAMQGVQNVNQGYAAPQMTDLAKFRTDFEDQRRQAASDYISQQMGVPVGMLSSGGSDSSGGGRNYYQEIEDRFYNENLALGATPEAAKTLAEQQRFEIQSANNQKFNDTLTSLSKGGIGGILSSLFSGSTSSLPAEVQTALQAQAAADEAAAAQSSGGGLSSYTTASGDTYTGSGGYGGGGSLESTYGGGL